MYLHIAQKSTFTTNMCIFKDKLLFLGEKHMFVYVRNVFM